MLISIIVPIYKIKYEYLEECLNSLAEQNKKFCEVILVDDGSPDDCGIICDRYVEKNKNFKCIHQKNMGVSESRNNGIKNAKGNWIMFVDPDDWLEPNAIDILCTFIKQNKNSDIFLYGYIEEKKDSKKEYAFDKLEKELSYDEVKSIQEAPFYKLIVNNKINDYSPSALWNKLYRKELIDENNITFIKEAKKGQDRLFNSDLLNCTKKYYNTGASLYHYRMYNESITNRFNKDIIDLTKIEIMELKRQIKNHQLLIEDKLNARICTRLYSCLRLNVFNKNNNLKFRDKIKAARSLTSVEPFNEALTNINYRFLTRKEKIFVYTIQKKLFIVCYILVWMNNKINRI